MAKTRIEELQVCKLLQCVRDQDREQIEKLCDSGVPLLINYNEPEHGDTALNIAATRNDEAMLEFLLSLGAHPDVVDFRGRSAVMRAAEYGHTEAFDVLAKAGANMKLKDVEGKGLLWYCLTPTERHAKIVELALRYGADVNNRSRDGVPIFVEACKRARDSESLCLTLLRLGAEANSRHESSGVTALMAACGAGNATVVAAILAAGGDPDALDRFNSHAAHLAAKLGSLACLAALAAYGANFDQGDLKNKAEGHNGGNTPLHYAAKGHAMCCRFLVQRGCNPKTKNNDGLVARAIAKDGNFKDCVKELLKGEKSFGKTGKNNEPWAVRLYDWTCCRSSHVVDMLRRYDPDNTGTIKKDDFIDSLQSLNAPLPDDNIKRILLAHDKGKDGNIDYEEFLSGKKYINKLYLMSSFETKKKGKKGGKKGGKKSKTKVPMPICTKEPGERTEGGEPPEDLIVLQQPFTDNQRFDRDRPPAHPIQDDSAWYMDQPDRVYCNVHQAVRDGDFDSLRIAIEKGSPVDVRDKYFKTPLMTAAAGGNTDMVKFLVERGADLKARDNFKWTSLHHACHGGFLDVVTYLLNNGADLDAVALNGGTPLTRAIESSRIDVVQYLISKGAKLQVETAKGQSLLDVASGYADPYVYAAVRLKFDGMPPIDDKKKAKGKGGKSSAKGRRSTTSGAPADKANNIDAAGTNGLSPGLDDGTQQAMRTRKGSILRAASALAGGLEEKEDITYVPLRAWTQQPTTEDLLAAKQARRERYGWEVDFPDFQMPFLKNATYKAKQVEMEED